QVGCCANLRIEGDACEKDRVLVPFVDRLDYVGLQSPEKRLPPAVRRDLRKCGAPRAATNDAQLHAFTPAPRTLSARSSRGQRARAGASRSSVSPATSRSAPAHAIIAALSVHSHAGGTLKRRPFVWARSASALRIAWLAATPPATT